FAFIFFLQCYREHRDLHSFPTRRSSDLEGEETGGDEGSDFSIAMVTDTGGVDDRSFNQSAWEGMQDWAEENDLGEDSVAYYQSEDRKSTRLNSSHVSISYAVFCLKKKKK